MECLTCAQSMNNIGHDTWYCGNCGCLKLSNGVFITPTNSLRTAIQRDDEAWMHAACLTIAETGTKWGDNVHPSPAMLAVYRLRKAAEYAYTSLSQADEIPSIVTMDVRDKLGEALSHIIPAPIS